MTNTIPTKYSHVSVIDFTNEEHNGLVLVKIRSSLWLVTETNGYYITHAKTKKSALEALKQFAAKRVAEVKKGTKVVKATAKKATREAKRIVTGNIMKFRFGQKISENTVKQYVRKTWGKVFKLVSADIENGYWGGIVEHAKTGEQFQVVRIDYVINYIRPPKGTETFEDVRAVMVAKGVATS